MAQAAHSIDPIDSRTAAPRLRGCAAVLWPWLAKWTMAAAHCRRCTSSRAARVAAAVRCAAHVVCRMMYVCACRVSSVVWCAPSFRHRKLLPIKVGSGWRLHNRLNTPPVHTGMTLANTQPAACENHTWRRMQDAPSTASWRSQSRAATSSFSRTPRTECSALPTPACSPVCAQVQRQSVHSCAFCACGRMRACSVRVVALFAHARIRLHVRMRAQLCVCVRGDACACVPVLPAAPVEPAAAQTRPPHGVTAVSEAVAGRAGPAVLQAGERHQAAATPSAPLSPSCRRRTQPACTRARLKRRMTSCRHGRRAVGMGAARSAWDRSRLQLVILCKARDFHERLCGTLHRATTGTAVGRGRSDVSLRSHRSSVASSETARSAAAPAGSARRRRRAWPSCACR